MSSADVRRELLAIASEAPPNPYAYPRTYVVRNGRADGKLDLDPPPDQRDALPTLAGVEVWCAPGMSVRALPGDLVVVIFRDANSARPVVVAFAPLSTGRHPRVTLDADAVELGGAGAPAAREGGSYTLGTASGVLTFVPAAPPFDAPSRVKV